VTSGVPAQGQNHRFHSKIILSASIRRSATRTLTSRFPLVSPYNGFVDRPLAAAADAINDGVAVDAANGVITITLASGSAIPAGSYVRVMLGTNASFDSEPVHFQIANPSSTASYRILLNTLTGASAAVDNGAAMVAILPAVGVDVNENKITPAILSNGLPTGTIPFKCFRGAHFV
jgi:hypothetical protein